VAKWIGEDHLLMASDYPHWDASMEVDMAGSLAKANLPLELRDKMLYANPKTLYNLPI